MEYHAIHSGVTDEELSNAGHGFIFVEPIQANTRYVSDILYVPLKKNSKGEGTLKHLKSGTVVSLLEEPKVGDYVKVTVHDESKSSGWVKAATSWNHSKN